MSRFTFISLLIILLSNLGCASFGRKIKSWISKKPSTSSTRTMNSASSKSNLSNGVSYSKVQDYSPLQKRKYKRVTKKTIENQSRIDSRAGSLWVNEGQGSYLFTQNIVRMIGDSLLVRLDGEPKQQLETKAQVIKDLLKKLENRRTVASNKDKKKDKGKKDQAKTKVTEPLNKAKDDNALKVKRVSTRIVERLIDGNYRIKGSQPFMIGKREYKVIVAGIIRSEDFNEDGVSANSLVEPQFDIISVRKGSR